MKLLSVTIFTFLTALCYSQVIINEVQSSNSSTIVDNYGEYEDWIEIYNPNNFEVDIGGLVLKDNVDTWQIPLGDTNTILLPQKHFIIWADDEEWQGKFHTNFKLSATNGELLGLFKPDSVTEIETVNIPPLSEDQSYGKCNGNWLTFSSPTPLMSNGCSSSTTETGENNGLLIYPTISDGQVKIDLQDYSSGIVNLFLFSMDGKLVLNKQYYNKAFTIELSDLTSDVYVLHIQTEQNLYTDKIVLYK